MQSRTRTQLLLAGLIALVLAVVALNIVKPGIFPQTSISSPGDRREGVVFRASVKALTSADSPYGAKSTDRSIFADATGGDISIALPATADQNGLRLSIKKVDASSNTVAIDPFGSETIDGQVLAFILDKQDEALTLLCDGDEWHIIDFTTWISDRVTTRSVTGVIHLPPMASPLPSCSQGDLYVHDSGALCVCTAPDDWQRANNTGNCP